MAETSGMKEIRGIDIDKLAKGFADEENVFKKFVTVSKTKARKIRWYRKASGFLDSVDTSGITASQIANTAFGAQPVVVEQNWTRFETDVRKYFVESPTITNEDIMDSDIDVLGTNVRDLVRSVQNQVDSRIYEIVTDIQATGTAGVSSHAAEGTGWDDTTNGNPVLDIMSGQEAIRTNGYNAKGVIIAMNPKNHKDLLNYLITVKGSSIPNFSSEQIRNGTVMPILGGDIVVSTNVVADSVAIWVPNRAATWKQFLPLTSTVINDEGIGKKIRVWELGECILTDPKAVSIITETDT